ncbi:MAG: NAD(P)-dependent oxidoreductase [Erythrobacter sp.]
MKLAITGATGFVGQAVLDAIAADTHFAHALTRRSQPAQRGVQWISGDLENLSALEELANGKDAVIHIAGLTNTPDPNEFDTANVEGTRNVIAAAKSAGVKRFVFVSSLSAREPHLSAYGASKARAEELIEASGLDWTIVRPPAVYGPRDKDMFELFRAAKFNFIPLPPSGATSIIHVEDLARLLIALAGPVAPSRLTFEPDDGRIGGWSHTELAHAIAGAVGKKVFAPNLPKSVLNMAAQIDGALRGDKAKLTPDRVGYMCHPNWVARSDKAVPDKIWAPKIKGDDGFAATAAWYREQGWL